MMSLRRIFLVMLALSVGSSLTFAQLTASKSSIAFGNVTVFTPKADSFYVKNTGGTDVAVTAVTNVAGVYLVAPFSGSLTPTIVANDSFWYRVTFTPNAVGTAPADTIQITTAAETLKVRLGGTGLNDVRLHNPRTGGQYTTSFAFVTSLAGQQRLDSITIRNLNTTNSIDVTSMTFTNPEFTVLTTLPVTINAADTAMFYLAYTGQEIGTDADVLTIVHTGAATGSSPMTLPVTARSVANVGLYPVRVSSPYTYSDATAPLLPLDTLVLNSASSVRYGQLAVPITPLIAVDSAKQGRIVVRNVGAGRIRLDSIAVGGPHFEVRATDQIPAGGIEIQAGSAYDRYFIFYFRAKVQNTAGILDTVYLYHGDTVQFSNPLKALIRAGSENRIYVTDATTGTSVAFGAVPLGTPKDAMIRIQNYRDIPLAVDSVVRATNISQVQILQNFLTSIPAGTIDTMKLRWLTSDTTSGTFVDTVIIYSPAFTTPRRFAISGSTARTIAFSPTSPFSFGAVQLDAPKDTVIRIYNRTETNYSINSIGLARDPSSQYLILSNTLTQAFNAGDSILIQLRYTPTALGPAPDTIIIAHDIPTQILSANPYRFAINGTGTIGTIDPTNYYTVDNVQGAEGVPIRSTDSTYWETGPFWENAGGSFGIGHRRSPNLSGSPNGSSTRYTFTLDTTGPYMVYQYCLNSPNIGQQQFFQVEKGGFGGIWDSSRYNLQEHITGNTSITNVYGGTWLPMGMYYFFGLGKGAAVVRIGSDNLSGSFLRVDASRLLRSQLPADIEFGRRDINFASTRVPEEFPATTLGDESMRLGKPYRLFNLGSDTLVITNIEFFVAGGSSRPLPWFKVNNASYPIVVPPMTADPQGREQGGYADIELVFAPFQEGAARDSMVIYSNDPVEPKAFIILMADAFNVNFIMNASAGNSQPHWRAPGPPEVATSPLYFEGPSGTWLSSTASNFPYPIPGGNPQSRVNTGAFTAGPHAAFYRFELPELYGGRINAAGQYILEYSGPITANAATASRVYVRNDLGQQIVPEDSVIDFNQNKTAPTIWMQVGGSTKTFALYPGAATTVEVRVTSGIGTGLNRVDLLRMRKVPTGALIGVNVNPQVGEFVNFGEVNFRDPAGPLGTANQKTVLVRSLGESQLEIQSMRFRQPNSRFSFVGVPPTPIYLRAIVGEINLAIAFQPDSIGPAYLDTLEIVTNSTRDSVLAIPLSGVGIGGVFVLDDNDVTAAYGQPTLAGLYVGSWDVSNMNHWQLQTFTGKADSVSAGLSRRMLPIYYPASNGTAYFDWYPNLPTEQDQTTMYAEVRVALPLSMTKASPAARYQVWTTGNVKALDTVISQNGRALSADGTYPYVTLGNFEFVRGGRDVAGSNQAVFGYVRLVNDTAAVSQVYAGQPTNLARRDTFALVADAVIIRELAPRITVGVEAEDNSIPYEFALEQNYPNPFNPTTTIRFSLAEQTSVELKIYDLLGREVRTLARGEVMKAGAYRVVWDGRNSINQQVATGVYFYRINAGGFVQAKKMLMLK